MFDPHWLASLQERAQQAPLVPRAPLWAQGHPIGSVLSSVCHALGSLVTPSDAGGAAAWQVNGPVTDTLNQIAHAMRAARIGHVAHYWRGEQLGVYSAGGECLGSVERGAVRPLGIATRAVHLVGRTASGGMWVQQRAFDKANDPGQWDTLMGGMISVHDDLHAALARETQEEAGLDVAHLHGLAQRGQVRVSRPTDDDVAAAASTAATTTATTATIATPGIGYMVEVIDWFDALVPEGMLPVNQDGEVAQFQLLRTPELIERLQRNEFTLEASMVLVAALQGQRAP
jgi:8-oxo-dGTP pyrophosphatase MutT (NUDIX family)